MDNNKPNLGVGVKKRRDVVIGLCVVFLALMFAGPGVIRQIMRSNFLAMDGGYVVHSPNFAASAETLLNDNGWVTATVVIKNITDRLISGVRANALLDDGFRPILAPGSASGLYFYDPGATGSWRILLRDIFHPPVIKLAPVSTPVDELGDEESSGLSLSRTFFVDARGLSSEQKTALLVAPIKVKIWHDGDTELLTVIPVPNQVRLFHRSQYQALTMKKRIRKTGIYAISLINEGTYLLRSSPWRGPGHHLPGRSITPAPARL